MNDFLQKANSFPMYAVAFVVIAVVMLMAAFFLFKAYREGLKIGMEKKKLHKVLTSSVIFSIVPSIGILMGVITLAGSLGIPLPWLRLSVIGALHYETMAADTAAKAAGRLPERRRHDRQRLRDHRHRHDRRDHLGRRVLYHRPEKIPGQGQ